MRRRVMINKDGGPIAGDILCAKEDGSKKVFKAEDYADINGSGWTPIGVVVIPPSHDVYGTGEGAAVALYVISNSRPDTGNTTKDYSNGHQVKIFNSKDGDISDIPNYNRAPNGSATTQSFTSSGSSVHLPTDTDNNPNNITRKQCKTDPITYYETTSSSAGPSPYLIDGSRNPDYYKTISGYTNFLSDFSGKEHTLVMQSLHTYQTNWRTASNIKVGNYAGNFADACCCWRYHTVGTNQGDWYIPAAGELGYEIVREQTISNVLLNLGAYYNNWDGTKLVPRNGGSSTEYDSSRFFVSNHNYKGYMTSSSKGGVSAWCRPYLRFKI